MSRANLDNLEYVVGLAKERGTFYIADPQTLLAMIAELRAAREVIAAILDDTNDVSMRVDIALDEYEKAASP